MSAPIIIVGDEVSSSKLLKFALENDFEIIQCNSTEEALKLEESLRISERDSVNGNLIYQMLQVGPIEPMPVLGFKSSPSKQQRREWRKNGRRY